MEVDEKVVINDFKNYLEEYDIKEAEISFQNVNDYLSSMYFDIFDNIESIEDMQLIEEEIENIIYNNFKVSKI